MSRGKNTNVYLQCKECKNQNYTTRVNLRTTDKLTHKKFCSNCNKSTDHSNTKEIKHSS